LDYLETQILLLTNNEILYTNKSPLQLVLTINACNSPKCPSKFTNWVVVKYRDFYTVYSAHPRTLEETKESLREGGEVEVAGQERR
jgi:hypothetical protein